MDEIAEAVEKVKKEWDEAIARASGHLNEIEEYGKAGIVDDEGNSLPRLNGLAQDALASLHSMQFRLDLLAQQLTTEEEVQSAQSTLKSWKDQCQRFNLHLGLRNANLQAKVNMRKAAQAELHAGELQSAIQAENGLLDVLNSDATKKIGLFAPDMNLSEFLENLRELLLGGGEESTIRRRNLQTKTGMTSAAESITESLRRTRQLMVQEVERSASTVMTFGESTGVLKNAESEYKGHRSLLMRTRNLLSTMQRQDVLDRVIIVVGFVLFSCAVLYVVSKRIGMLKLQRKLTAATKEGMVGQRGMRPRTAEDGFNFVHVHENVVPDVEVPIENMRDEL